MLTSWKKASPNRILSLEVLLAQHLYPLLLLSQVANNCLFQFSLHTIVRSCPTLRSYGFCLLKSLFSYIFTKPKAAPVESIFCCLYQLPSAYMFGILIGPFCVYSPALWEAPGLGFSPGVFPPPWFRPWFRLSRTPPLLFLLLLPSYWFPSSSGVGALGWWLAFMNAHCVHPHTTWHS